MAIPLNGWQRIGVVLSALWMIVLLFWGLNDYSNGSGVFAMTTPGETVIVKRGAPGQCTQEDPAPSSTVGLTVQEFLGQQKDANGRSCLSSHYVEGMPDVTQKTPDRHEFLTGFFLFLLFIPPLLVWILVYVCVFSVRWIANGFKKKL